MAVVVFAVTLLISGAIYATVLALATGERARAFKAMSPVMLTPLAVVFGLIIAFLASQVWTDVERANNAVIREANALRSVVVLAAYYPQEQETRIRAFVRRHIQNAVNEEWPAMAKRRANLPLITAAYSEGLQLALSIVPQNEAQMIVQREMVSSLQSAFDARRQRIIISESTINWVKWSVIGLLAVLLLVTIAIIHSDNRATAAISMAIFSVAVAASIVLIASHNRPFTGEISVGPTLLMQVLPEEKP
jgi:type IV secretory pathway VirJ component